MLRNSLFIATLGGLVATGVATLPAQAHGIATAKHRSSISTARAAHVPAVLAGITAARHRRGTLTGIVVGSDGRPLAGACVAATGSAGRAMTMTRADGRYVLPRLRPGSYTLRYQGCAFSQRSSGQAAPNAGLPDQPAARLMSQTVVAGVVQNLPAVMLPTTGPGTPGNSAPGRVAAAAAPGTGQIRGVVTGNGHPVSGICVEADPVRSGLVPTTTTSASGHYTLRKVPAGRYTVEFANSFDCPDPGNWLSQWYKGLTTPFFTDKATVVRVAKGKITRGINASLRRGGQISGTVRNKSGTPIKGICVTVDGRVAGGYTEAVPRTGKLGRYVVHGLFKGSYVVGFRVGCGSTGNYAPQWWRDAASQRAATHIRITGTRHVSGVDGRLVRGSGIAGVVHAGSLSGPRLRGICVDAINFRTGVSADARTNSNGRYKLIGLSAGTYSVQYQTGCGNHGNYLEANRRVTVGKGQTKRGVDVALKLGAGLSGTATNKHGKPVGGICVDISGNHGSGFGDTETNADGTYKATGLNPGTYTVQFSGGCGNRGSYLPQYYDGKTTQATADPVKLTAGHITTGIDAVMQPGATITGTITDAAGHRLSDVCVGIDTRADQFLSVDGEFTDIEFSANGSYRASNLSPGAYSVDFGCGVGAVASVWFRSHRAATRADLVSASAGRVTSGISAVMRPAGSITGTVTSRTGKPLPGICVFAVPVASQYPPVIVLGEPGPVKRNGSYRIGHLGAGRYDVQFFSCDGFRYGSQWYRAKHTQDSATPVRVRVGRVTPHIDAKLGLGGSISGRIVSSTGQPGKAFCTEAFDAASQSFGLGFTDSTGRYKITGLSTGAYQIFAYRCSGPNLTSITRPGHVRVRAPNAVTGINVRLPAAGSISGTVLAGSPPAARGDVCVLILPVKRGGSFGFALTRPDGTYKVGGLAAGQYQVNFADPYCFAPDDDLASQWFDQQQSQPTANEVTVTAGATTGGINATLVTNGSISGSVTDQAHAPVGGECVTAIPVGAAPDSFLEVAEPRQIAVTSPKGSYSLARVLPGRYKVEFSAGCGGASFKTQWWQNAGTAAAATVITVGAGASVAGIDAALGH